ncbi:hypothetical protein SDC9_97777 [bioreactor metagenome]|uniref:Uncharacterized protein n=1 Tax=bioreactor metagenome TaxID=1076179 RepID=A0A645AFH9_9ZZZZ
MHFWELVTRPDGGVATPVKYGLKGAMPAPISKRLGSFSGTNEALGKTKCPFSRKNSKYA